MVSRVHRQEPTQPLQEERVPIDTGGRGYVSKDMKASSDDVWLGHSLADAERANITGFEVCPLVQLLPSLTQNRLRAPSVQFLKDDITVSRPLVDKTIFVVVEFSRDKKVFTSPLGALLIRAIIVQNGISYSRRRDTNLAKLSHKESVVVVGINLTFGCLPPESDRQIVGLILVGERRKLVRELVSINRQRPLASEECEDAVVPPAFQTLEYEVAALPA
jgi:hypothetical protein